MGRGDGEGLGTGQRGLDGYLRKEVGEVAAKEARKERIAGLDGGRVQVQKGAEERRVDEVRKTHEGRVRVQVEQQRGCLSASNEAQHKPHKPQTTQHTNHTDAQTDAQTGRKTDMHKTDD